MKIELDIVLPDSNIRKVQLGIADNIITFVNANSK